MSFLSGKSGYTNKTVICLLLEAYLTVYKSLICLDSNLKLHAASKRICYFSVVLGGMLVFWLWEAQLINYFTVTLQRLPFNDLEEFLSKSNKKVNNKIMRNITRKPIKKI